MLDRRLKLGTFFGIGLYVHWTFALLLAYVAFMSGGLLATAVSLAFVTGLFVCVTLHEYGHALTARRFGIPTVDITLLPIGGVARLQRMPRIPWQELVVAVAGPAVNVVIAAILFLGLTIAYGLGEMTYATGSELSGVLESVTAPAEAPVEGDVPAEAEPASGEAPPEAEPSSDTEPAIPSFSQFAFGMMLVNLMLVVFNMIPAFPMDGGRVFRSTLAMVVDYRTATFIASRVGLVCAGLMVLAWMTVGTNPFLILIAAFIGFAGVAEARQVDVLESVRGLKVGEAMVRSEHVLSIDEPLVEIARRWRGHRATSLPVVSGVGSVIGMLRLEDLVEALHRGVDPHATAGELVNPAQAEGPLRADQSLESVVMQLGYRERQLAVVDADGRLAGVLDLNSMILRGKLARQVPVEMIPQDRFEAFS